VAKKRRPYLWEGKKPAKRHKKKPRNGKSARPNLFENVPPMAGTIIGLGLLGGLLKMFVPPVGEYVDAVRRQIEGGDHGAVSNDEGFDTGLADEEERPPPKPIKLVKGEDGVWREPG
jgi:hypothetical protein